MKAEKAITTVTDELLDNFSLINEIMMSKIQLRRILSSLEKVLSNNIEGDVVELGCNEGTTSVFIRRLLMKYNSIKTFHVYDSFEGLPEKSEYDLSLGPNKHSQGECKTTEGKLLKNFQDAKLPPPIIHAGWFKEIPDKEYPDKIAFAFFDGDFYTSIIDSFNKVYHKLMPNAIVCLHDYCNQNLAGVKKACADFLKGKPEIIQENDLMGYFIKA